jgi:SAM-dependent methyltransferase
MRAFTLERCVACGSERLTDLGVPPLQTLDSPYRVTECTECGLRWSDPMPTPAALEAHYTTYYARRFAGVAARRRNVLYTKALRASGWFRWRHESFLALIARFAPRGVLLDFGAGEGEMLQTARDHGWEAIGIDYSAETVAPLRARGFDMRVGSDFASAGVAARAADVLVLKHVIEHLVDLETFLADARRVLKVGGVLAVKTPSRTTHRARLRLARWHHVNPPEHQWSFQPKAFRLLMERHGFDVEYLRDSLVVDELICLARVRPV